MFQNTLKFMGLTSGLCLATACGGGFAALADQGTDKAALTDGSNVVKQVRLIEGDFSTTGNSPECLALRTKLFAKRQLVKASSEWGTIKDTPEFKVLSDHENQFIKVGCKVDNPGTSDVCKKLDGQLQQDGEALAKTPQWQTLTNNSNWKDLQTDYGKAQQLGCV